MQQPSLKTKKRVQESVCMGIAIVGIVIFVGANLWLFTWTIKKNKGPQAPIVSDQEGLNRLAAQLNPVPLPNGYRYDNGRNLNDLIQKKTSVLAVPERFEGTIPLNTQILKTELPVNETVIAFEFQQIKLQPQKKLQPILLLQGLRNLSHRTIPLKLGSSRKLIVATFEDNHGTPIKAYVTSLNPNTALIVFGRQKYFDETVIQYYAKRLGTPPSKALGTTESPR